MSEDCHDSNNENPFRVTRGDMAPFFGTPIGTVACLACGEPVKPEDAFLSEIEHPDGTTEVAVFHAGIDRMCPLKWAGERLQAINRKLEAILDLMETIKEPDASSGL
jgi:hypothetical protein